jgi:hypothetical protein
MLGELRNLPTDMLLKMLSVILAGGRTVTSSDVDELEQLQIELQRRGDLEASAYQA